MGRGAPNKKGLDYFPKMVDFYEDDKVFDLLEEYGPLGVTIYDVILTIVYANGYYVEMTADKLSRMVIRKIGSKWVPNKRVVVQVIHFCADSGLLDAASLSRGVITSVGIQKRFYRIAVKLMKRQLYNDRYWLLDFPKASEKEEENEGPLLNSPKNRIVSEENRITSEINHDSSEKSTLKGKENKEYIYTAAPDKPFENPELENAFQFFLVCRKHNGVDLLPEQIHLLRDELMETGSDDRERIAVAKKAAASNWTSFYSLRGNGSGKKLSVKQAKAQNRFNNFKQRDYDYGELERQLLETDRQRGTDHAEGD